MDLIDKNITIIQNLCKRYKVLRLFAFGSVLTDKFRQDSDVDLLVEFDTIDLKDYADNYFDFKFSLRDLLKKEIDLLENKGLKNPFLKQSIDSTKKMIYG
ncbi:MAG: nucleotidyltransferase domain-containing protein [Bacteroidetes bacterium]|nr:nucleotidyltransferase domain-containing protein [Bacteroidota bacterium]